MKKLIVILAGLFLSTLPSFASDRKEDILRIQSSTRVLQEIMATPDKGIPKDLLKTSSCVVIIPGEKKAAFIFGANYGKGIATCRTENGWSAPMFLMVAGGSYGFQIGGSSTDVVLIFMNDHALQSLLSDKFKLGGDVTVAAGPVGRQVSANTDLKLNAEILSYSRSKGIFAGISLDGTVVKTDKSGDRAMYGQNINRHMILNGNFVVPTEALSLVNQLNNY
jgi:SH3 domain-containing YSC84-like protein 1